RLRLETVCRRLSAAVPCTRQADLRRDIEDESKLGHCRSNSHALETADQPLVNITKSALIDTRGIDKAVADDPLAGLQSRQNRIAHVIVASRCKKNCFCFGSERLGNT